MITQGYVTTFNIEQTHTVRISLSIDGRDMCVCRGEAAYACESVNDVLKEPHSLIPTKQLSASVCVCLWMPCQVENLPKCPSAHTVYVLS